MPFHNIYMLSQIVQFTTTEKCIVPKNDARNLDLKGGSVLFLHVEIFLARYIHQAAWISLAPIVLLIRV